MHNLNLTLCGLESLHSNHTQRWSPGRPPGLPLPYLRREPARVSCGNAVQPRHVTTICCLVTPLTRRPACLPDVKIKTAKKSNTAAPAARPNSQTCKSDFFRQVVFFRTREGPSPRGLIMRPSDRPRGAIPDLTDGSRWEARAAEEFPQRNQRTSPWQNGAENHWAARERERGPQPVAHSELLLGGLCIAPRQSHLEALEGRWHSIKTWKLTTPSTLGQVTLNT